MHKPGTHNLGAQTGNLNANSYKPYLEKLCGNGKRN